MTVYAVIGQTLAGKDTLVRDIITSTGIKRILTTTDRPIREGEIDGFDYHFVDVGELDNDKYFGVREFFTVYRKEPYCYGMNDDSFNLDEDSVIILDPLGVRALKDRIGSQNVVTVYLNIEEDTLKERALKRGDSIEEVQRRLDDDRHLFKNAEIYCDIILNEYEDNLSTMYNIIKGRTDF